MPLRKVGQPLRPDVGPCQDQAANNTVRGACEAGKEAKRSRLFGKTPVITLTVNGVPVDAMADSGAEISLVTKEWYINHLLPGRVVLHEANWQNYRCKWDCHPLLGLCPSGFSGGRESDKKLWFIC